ncbi:MAG: segregation/condensation protein A [Alphaproteobacteria bacterium 64-6]|nr:MAG: segregation/condensation protein A [Alphaproteobacteria bacterium 64-6]
MDGGTGEANAGPEEWGDPERGDAPPPEDAFVVDLEGFEGPLDLLLALARTQKVDLARISIDTLVTQYLSYIREAQKLRLELAADYLVMAAWLAFLKSRLLLPRDEKAEDGPSGEELAARLAFRLMRLEAMRNAAAQLLTRKRLDRDIFPRGMPEGVKTIRTREHSAEIYDLLKAYAEQRTRTVVHRAHVVKKRTVWSIKDARQRLETLIGRSAGSWVQLDFFLEQYLPSPELGRTALASSFGATLEMAREGHIEIRQAGPFAPIYLRRKEAGAEWQRLDVGGSQGAN